MSKQFAIGVVANQASRGLCPGESVTVDGQRSALFLAEINAQRSLFKGPAALEVLLKALKITLGNSNQFRQFSEQLFSVFTAFRNNGQIIARPIVGDQCAITIVDQASGRGQRSHQNPVFIGLSGKVFVARNLQIEIARDKDDR